MGKKKKQKDEVLEQMFGAEPIKLEVEGNSNYFILRARESILGELVTYHDVEHRKIGKFVLGSLIHNIALTCEVLLDIRDMVALAFTYQQQALLRKGKHDHDSN